jgi:endonuclease YncB( thermonuclease family)
VVVDVLDGDTITLGLTIHARIRMIDCWAPETRTKDADEKKRGIASKEHLKGLLPTGAGVRVEIPLDGTTRLDDLFTMGRVLGTVWRGEVNISDEQVRAGHATKEKP